MAQRQVPLDEQLHIYSEFLHRVVPRWWVVVLCTLGGAALAIALALILPRIYASRALVTWQEGVNQRRVFSREEAASADWTWLQGRLEFLASSDTRLRRLIRELDLYPGRRSEPEAKVLERMRESIKYDSLGGTTFWLSFEYPDRYRAQAVAAQLLHDFIEQNAADAVSGTAALSDFMENEARQSRRQIDEIDHLIARFVSQHPQFQTDPATGMLRGRLADAPAPTPSLPITVDSPELRRALLEKGQIQAQLRLAEGGRADATLGQLRQELTAAQRTLVVKRQRYTDAHPDVQRTRAYLLQVQAQLRAAEGARRNSGASAQRLRDRLDEIDARVATLSRPKPVAAATRQTPKTVRARPRRTALTASAQLEKRWYELTRDRTVAKARLDQLQDQAIRSRMRADLEKQRAMMQFDVVDPPNLPARPIRPSRVKLAIAGTLFGLLIGIGLAGMMVLLDPRVYSREDVRRACDLPVLALVPRDAA